jgi:hypothetical protein
VNCTRSLAASRAVIFRSDPRAGSSREGMELSPQIKIILGDQQPAVIGAAWNHPDGPAAGVKAMNEGILKF